MTLPSSSSSSSAKGVLAIAAVVVFLSGMLLLHAAQAQQPGSNNNKFKVNLSETLAAGDAASKGPSLKNSSAISDRAAVSDTISKSVEKPIHRSVATKVSIKDSVRKSVAYATHKVSRSVFGQILIGDLVKGPSAVAVEETLAVSERPLLSGAIVPPYPPQLAIAGGQKTFRSDRDDSVAIAFNSSSSGTYKVDIDDAAGDTVATITGAMAAGENQAKWTGVDLQDKAVPSGTYTYYISAKNDKGVRAAPSGGDGTIVVASDEDGDNTTTAAGAPPFLGISRLKMLPAELLMPVIVAVVAGAAVLFIIIIKKRRRSKDLVLYLPADAAPVVDDIRQKYPGATVEDYVSTGKQGASKRYIGVTIADSRESDDGWILGIIARAKELAGVDSINLTYRGRMKTV